MKVETMNQEECESMLNQAVIGHLACALDNQPYIVQLSFIFNSGHLYAFSTFGKKTEWMRQNPKVCVQFDELKSRFDWSSVTVYGSYRELVEPRYTDELTDAKNRFEQREHWWETAMAAGQLDAGEHLIEPVYFAIDIDSVSGLKAVPA